jgi:hypothetical protein
MKLNKIKKDLNLEVLYSGKNLDAEVKGGYTSDLLSDVMANSKEKYIWITLQVHLNIVAVAKLKELSGIILVNSRKPDSDTLEKALQENLPIFTTPKTAFEISGELYQLLKGK